MTQTMLVLFLFLILSVTTSRSFCRVEKPSTQELEILTADLFCENRTEPTLRSSMNRMYGYYKYRRFRNCATLESDKLATRNDTTHTYPIEYSSILWVSLLVHGCERFVETEKSYTFEYLIPTTLDERLMETLNQIVIWLASENACDPKSKAIILESCRLIQSGGGDGGIRTLNRGYLLLSACNLKNFLSSSLE